MKGIVENLSRCFADFSLVNKRDEPARTPALTPVQTPAQSPAPEKIRPFPAAYADGSAHNLTGQNNNATGRVASVRPPIPDSLFAHSNKQSGRTCLREAAPASHVKSASLGTTGFAERVVAKSQPAEQSFHRRAVSVDDSALRSPSGLGLVVHHGDTFKIYEP